MKVAVISLGCDKNTVDTEMMLGILNGAGHELVYDETESDAVIINTCAFILDAKQESIDNILECARLKSDRLTTGSGGPKYIIITGCLAQRYENEIIKDIPEVDAIIGVQSFDKIAEVLNSLEANAGEMKATDTASSEESAPAGATTKDGKIITDLAPLSEAPISGHKRLLTTPTHYAYLKIAEGCSKGCTYCIIPSMRGRYRSVPMQTLIDEATDLADRGVKELILVAQETTVYGVDLYGKKSIVKLIKNLAAIEGIEYIRLMYCYPEEITDELIDLMRNEPKLCHYIDMPIQHASDRVLKRMGRRTNEAEIRGLIGRLRTEIPDICIRTTLMTGFPGEKHSDYKVMYNFVRDLRFDRLGVFTYSPEEGTVAASMAHQLPEFIKKIRKNRIMKLQQQIVFETNSAMTGRIMDVIIQGRIPEDDVAVARSYRDAPDVDGNIYVETDVDYISGTVIKVKITGFKDYDLVAVPVNDNEERQSS